MCFYIQLLKLILILLGFYLFPSSNKKLKKSEYKISLNYILLSGLESNIYIRRF